MDRPPIQSMLSRRVPSAGRRCRIAERQRHLFRQGRDEAGNRIGPVVTNARAWSSFHKYGLAADFVPFIDGQWRWDDSGRRAVWWSRLQAFGRDAGLKSLSFEKPHLELVGASIDELRAGTLPDGGDVSWREYLEAAARRWIGSPAAPGFAIERPPLPELVPAPAQ
ncbi:MAG: M15 family metallopeptidase [Alphaproteobacteria bacterium]|nr:M15 family metallopeptidase [Alphaproteobacteria bacterium]